MVAPTPIRSPRKPARYLTHCNMLRQWHKDQADLKVQLGKSKQKLFFATVMLIGSVSGAAFFSLVSVAGLVAVNGTLAEVRKEMAVLGAGAAEASVQREHREINKAAIEHNASLLNPVAIILNETPIGMQPEQLLAQIENNKITLMGRATAINGQVKYDFMRTVEERESTLDPKIDDFAIEDRDGIQRERFSYIVTMNKGAKEE